MQRSRLFASLAAFIMASTIIMSVSAAAYQVKPAVGGTDSEGIVTAEWRKNQGLKDASGKEAFALLLRKDGLSIEPVSAKGIVQNEKGAKLEDLAFWVREDGQCGALAPRFEVTTGNGNPPVSYPCASGIESGSRVDRRGRLWTKRTFAIDARQLTKTISNIEIVFDQGTDPGPAYTYLDDIEINEQVIGQPAPPRRRR